MKLLPGVSSPHIRNSKTTPRLMWLTSLSLLPASLWGVYQFGRESLWVLLAAIISSVLTEAALNRLDKKTTITDGSAFLTGLLIGLNMPPSLPLFIPVVAAVFAIAVVKWTFGGLGKNWMNPALAGRVFVFFSWTGPMTRWMPPRVGGIDAVTMPTPLGIVKTALFSREGASLSGPMEVLSSEGQGLSYGDLFLGRIPGSLGEISACLLLIGAIFLLIMRIITWHVPITYLGSFAFLVWIFGGSQYGEPLFAGDVLFHLLSGGVMLGAFFMATDLVTSPETRRGMMIYGVGCGACTFLIRIMGSLPEGVSLAIIIMNMFVPLIDRLVKVRRLGVRTRERYI